MNLATIRTILTASLLSLLTACGAGAPTDAIDASAAVKVATTASGASAFQATSAQAALPVQAVTAQQPLPDCQPENCAGLRIIDGNAEAFRIDAMRRAAHGS
jgi:hypothetical protein